jgi:hypothetical protein
MDIVEQLRKWRERDDLAQSAANEIERLRKVLKYVKLLEGEDFVEACEIYAAQEKTDE